MHKALIDEAESIVERLKNQNKYNQDQLEKLEQQINNIKKKIISIPEVEKRLVSYKTIAANCCPSCYLEKGINSDFITQPVINNLDVLKCTGCESTFELSA